MCNNAIDVTIRACRIVDMAVLEWFAKNLGDYMNAEKITTEIYPAFRKTMREQNRWNHTLLDAMKCAAYHDGLTIEEIITTVSSYHDAIMDIRDKSEMAQGVAVSSPPPDNN